MYLYYRNEKMEDPRNCTVQRFYLATRKIRNTKLALLLQQSITIYSKTLSNEYHDVRFTEIHTFHTIINYGQCLKKEKVTKNLVTLYHSNLGSSFNLAMSNT